jgi:hypothetical protein
MMSVHLMKWMTIAVMVDPMLQFIFTRVGGTTIEVHGSTIINEVVWNHDEGATGGGISEVFDLPDYQANANVPKSANPNGHIGKGVLM